MSAEATCIVFLILIYVLSVLALLKSAIIFSLLALLMTLLVTHASMPLMVCCPISHAVLTCDMVAFRHL